MPWQLPKQFAAVLSKYGLIGVKRRPNPAPTPPTATEDARSRAQDEDARPSGVAAGAEGRSFLVALLQALDVDVLSQNFHNIYDIYVKAAAIRRKCRRTRLAANDTPRGSW